ncbi:MAG: CpsB/CapC family capsule biosynthesis tyrosine phosphatase [Candidatus Aminicenantales bacterium]
MIDLHNHLLPDWDDGAADAAESLRMLEVARADGISKIVLTPHVFRMTRPKAMVTIVPEAILANEQVPE